MQQTDGIGKTLAVILGLCLVCSFLVSTAAVVLHPMQENNKRFDRIENILAAADLYKEGMDIAEVYSSKIKPIMIQLDSGEKVSEERFDEILNITDFNIRALVNNPDYSREIPTEHDIARIERIPKYMVVYFVMDEAHISRIILPVYGKGLWSTLRGFLALNRDLKTIEGITFYEHGETPGLGGEIDNPRWKAEWKGKKAFDDAQNLMISVIHGTVDKKSPEAKFQVDGLTGATLTTRGVDHLVRFWLGKEGYGPFLARLREEMR